VPPRTASAEGGRASVALPWGLQLRVPLRAFSSFDSSEEMRTEIDQEGRGNTR
jgi:hypothetical protein